MELNDGALRALNEARALLENITPLKSDCGRLCGSLCCKDGDGEEEAGMLLFPGEEKLYAHQGTWMELLDSALLFRGEPVRLLVCSLPCPRRLRPLSCRIFPLFPYLTEKGVEARLDVRARPLCPLCDYGEQGLDPAFVRAVRDAGEILAQDPAQREFLRLLTEHIGEYLWL